MHFAFQGVFSSWIWLHFETYIDHCHELIHFAHESVFCFSLDQVSSLWTSHQNHITIWPNSSAKCPKDTGRTLINSQKSRAPWSYILVNGGSTYNVEWTRLTLWATQRNSWSKKMQHVDLNMQHPLQPKKGVVIYKLLAAFELAQFFFQEEISLWRLESFEYLT